MMKIGDRVISEGGEIGHIEQIDYDPGFPCADVRWLTPNNEPSVLSSLCRLQDIKSVGDNVVPMQKNAEWWAQSREFCAVIENILSQEL